MVLGTKAAVFRHELNIRARGKGCSISSGLAHGDENRQDYAFKAKGRSLSCHADGDKIVLKVMQEAPLPVVVGKSKKSAAGAPPEGEREKILVKEIQLTWKPTLSGWFLEDEGDRDLLKMGEQSHFDHENLAQCCVNWLTR